MINIRCNVFETNSSSTHCLVILTKDQYKRLQQLRNGGYIKFVDNGSTYIFPSQVSLFDEDSAFECAKAHNEFLDDIESFKADPCYYYDMYDLRISSYSVIGESDDDGLVVLSMDLVD